MGSSDSPPTLVLASSSPWRRALCEQVGLSVVAMAPRCDEERITAADPVSLALARARAKAESLAQEGTVVIGADQVCHRGERVFHKPKDHAEHRAQLRELRGRTHRLTDGVVILGPGGADELVVFADVTLRADLTDDEIERYVASGDAEGCAGGYRAEGPGAWLVDRIVGDGFTVVGLPLYEVLRTLRLRGWRRGGSRLMSAALPHGSQA